MYALKQGHIKCLGFFPSFRLLQPLKGFKMARLNVFICLHLYGGINPSLSFNLSLSKAKDTAKPLLEINRKPMASFEFNESHSLWSWQERGGDGGGVGGGVEAMPVTAALECHARMDSALAEQL